MGHLRIELKAARAAVFFLLLLVPAAVFPAAGPKTPDISLKSISVESVSLGDRVADVSVSLEVRNPGPAVKVRDLRYLLKLNGVKVAEGGREQELMLPSDSSTQVDLPVKVDLSTIPGIALTTAEQGLNLKYELETEGKIPFLIFTHKLNKSFEGEIQLKPVIRSIPGRIIQWFRITS